MDLAALEAGRQLPDVVEGQAGEGAAPAHGVRDAAYCRQDDVAQRLPQVEALVRELPHAVDTVGVVRFS